MYLHCVTDSVNATYVARQASVTSPNSLPHRYVCKAKDLLLNKTLLNDTQAIKMKQKLIFTNSPKFQPQVTPQILLGRC